MWIVHNGHLCADAHQVTQTEVHNMMLLWGPIHIIAYLSFWQAGLHVHDGMVANGDELYTSFIYAWADDVIGNTTKLINTHKNVYLAHANIPGWLLQQEYFVRFISTLPKATMPEQFEAVQGLLSELMSRRTHVSPPCVFNAHTRRMCKYRLVLPGLPADNPQQSEEASHIGPSRNCKCRRCFPGRARTVETTVAEIWNQLNQAAEGMLAPVLKMQTASGTKDRAVQAWIIQVVAKAKELWKNCLDPHHDTLVELLHTVLLGSVKYVWHHLHMTLTDQQCELFVTWLYSMSIDGLSVPPICAGYMCYVSRFPLSQNWKGQQLQLVGCAPDELSS
ncbi:hypothetical protein JB92DRAFT_3084166 [Gautieria morchelliformis]|nr:hypothetical protein JB92DRAFT_3084166 [Gautieria morchelliformis]